MILFHPHKNLRRDTDPKTQEIMAKTVAFFENKGKLKLKQDDHERVWYRDFLDFLAKEKIFSHLLTPSKYGTPECRWDNYRNCEFNEILGFYGLPYWYTWQVTILGLGPLWMSKNEEIKKKTATLLAEGGIFGFGLSEKEHGADLYSSEMALTPLGSGQYLAKGRKYYIGNGNEAALLSTFGKLTDSGDYVFFAVDPKREKFELVKNVVNSQSYVAEYALHGYKVSENEILSKGQEAWDSSLNTVNVGKFNLGWTSIGMCTHAFYESINHASHRRLFGHAVTEFAHIQQLFTDSYARLCAMKLFASRASDYMRTASADDRRYLLYNPMVKMKVTTQGEEVINQLWDIIAARGFEKDMVFESVARDIRALPKLEGTVHVNMALIIKFMKNYFFSPSEYPEIGTQNQAKDDTFLFNQGATKGLSKIRFHDYRKVYSSVDLPNIAIFRKQIRLLKSLLMVAKPSKKQTEDFDFLLILGELFTLVVYGQLLIESAKLNSVDDDLLDQIFDFMVRDFSKFALQLYSKTSSTKLQQLLCLQMIRKPTVNVERAERIWKTQVETLKDQYRMKE